MMVKSISQLVIRKMRLRSCHSTEEMNEPCKNSRWSSPLLTCGSNVDRKPINVPFVAACR